MTNKDFYAFCRDQRKVETDLHKKQALQDMYGYLRECGVSKAGVSRYADAMIYRARGNEPSNEPLIAAYRWLLTIFAGAGQPILEGLQAWLTLRHGKYTTVSGLEARINWDVAPGRETIGWVKGVGMVAFNSLGEVAYEHIPKEYNLVLDSWQSMPEPAREKG